MSFSENGLRFCDLQQWVPAKKAAREQKQLEKAFLDTMSKEEAANLRNWQLAAAASAKLLVSSASARAIAAVQFGTTTNMLGPNIATSELRVKRDPGGKICPNSECQCEILQPIPTNALQ